MAELPSLTPNFCQPGKSVAGNILTADRLAIGLAPKGSDAPQRLLSLLPYGIPGGTVSALALRPHSDHGSLSDVIGFLGPALGFDLIADRLVVGHWLGSAGSSGAEGGGPSLPAAGTHF